MQTTIRNHRRRNVHRSLAALTCALAITAASVLPAARTRAESWCAEEILVHEWGVHAFAGSGPTRVTATTPMPSYFHNRPSDRQLVDGPEVNSLPADSGERELPVVQFYLGRGSRSAPVAVEVGFTHGAATHWYPQLNPLRGIQSPSLRARELYWPRLMLSPQPEHSVVTTPVAWVNELRANSPAAWVNNRAESERFVFYEGATTERPALEVTRGPRYARGRRHLLLRNTSAHTVHDVFFIANEGGATFLFHVPAIPPGRSSGFVVEDHATPANTPAGEFVRTQIRNTLLDPAHQGVSPNRVNRANCVMMRNPATPFTAAQGHALFPQEVDVIMHAWGERLADAPGATIVYREDAALLDAEMPIGVYTDMHHHVKLHRASLAIMENVQLP